MHHESDRWFSIPKELQMILIAATVIFAFNVWEHSPIVVPNHYTDIVSIYYREGIGNGTLGIPYVDYVFEYPVLVGVVVFVAALLARSSTSDFLTSMVRYKLTVDLVLYAFTLILLVFVYKLATRNQIDSKRIWQVFLVMPSLLMFVDYNFDIIAIAFMILALYLFVTGEHSISAISLGLGVCTKLYPGVVLPALLAALPSWRSRGRYLGITAAVVAAANLPFMLMNLHTWFGTWEFLSGWGIENSWLIFFFNQMDPLAHYLGFAVFLYLVYKIMIATRHHEMSSNQRLLVRSFLLSLAWLLGSYIVTPQMALLLLPFYVLIPAVPLLGAYASDTLNALIMVFWFTEMNAGRNPIAPDNPIQWISLARQLVWLALLIQLLYPSKVSRWVKQLISPLNR